MQEPVEDRGDRNGDLEDSAIRRSERGLRVPRIAFDAYKRRLRDEEPAVPLLVISTASRPLPRCEDAVMPRRDGRPRRDAITPMSRSTSSEPRLARQWRGLHPGADLACARTQRVDVAFEVLHRHLWGVGDE